MRRSLMAIIVVLLLAACGRPPSPTPTPAVAPPPAETPTLILAPPITPPPTEPPATPSATPAATIAPTAAAGDLGDLSFRLEPVASGFSRPTFIAGAGDGSGRLFVTEQAGAIWAVRDGSRGERPFLDIGELVGASGNEQGLLSVAFHPRYVENGMLFVYYTDRRGDTVVARYQVSDDPDLADPASATVVLTQDQPAGNHNGGQLAFGPDGYLYVGLGDGGGGGDTYGNGQNLGSLLGAILRLDVDGEQPYAAPADNPFVGRDAARPEIWAWGLRNPWRFSFDRATGDLYIADVGQNAVEEVNVQPAASAGGENYGWNRMEGASCFRATACDQSGLTLPVATYAHGSAEGGCSITGGYVYRGVYFYSDYCSGNLWGLRRQGGGWEGRLLGQLRISPSSFGQGDAGELYVAGHRDGVIYRLIVE